MKVIDIEDFSENCMQSKCIRYGNSTLYNKKTCKTEHKQKKCYNSYIISLEKQKAKMIVEYQKNQDKLDEAIDNNFENTIDLKWEDIKKQVWERDTNSEYSGCYKYFTPLEYCVIWNKILTKSERHHIIKYFLDDIKIVKFLSNMHIESRQRRPDLIYDVNNIILAHNFFHIRFDNFLDLATGKQMSNDDRNIWIQRFKNYIEGVKK